MTNQTGKFTLWPIWLALFLVGAVISLYAMKFHDLALSQNPDDWGTFGDYLGGLLNPIFSACTLFIAIQVWQLQKTELHATQSALSTQAETAKKTRIEQRFFDLMNFYHQTLESFQYKGSVGKSALTIWLLDQGGHLSGLTRDQIRNGNQNPTLGRIDAANLNWQEGLQNQWQKPEISQQLSHYFRVVFRLLSDAETILGDDRQRFIRMFRAQLSQTELLLIGLNLWIATDGHKMKNIAAEYGLIKHLPVGTLRSILEKKLSPKVFGRNFLNSHI